MKFQQILFYVVLGVLFLPNALLAHTETMPAVGKVTQLTLPTAVYWLLLTLRRKPGVMAWWLFPALFLGAFQLVLTYLFGQGVIAVDMWLNLVTTNVGEVNELLSQLLPVIFAVVVLYIPLLAAAVCSIRSHTRLTPAFLRKNRLCAGALFVVGMVTLGASYATGRYRVSDDLFPLNACYNCYLSFGRNTAAIHYAETSADFRFEARATHPDTLSEVVVCVVGETSRAMNWQLYGYGRPTNPVLSRREGLLVYGDYLSQSNTTHKSVPILLSAASAEDYDVLYRTKGILAAYREAGFHTCFFSNQQRNHSFIDFLGEQADECLFVKETGEGPFYDDALLPHVADALAAHLGKLFVVLHTYGSHFNYNDRYAPAEAAFQPDRIVSAESRYRRELINAYDNAICATDAFLGGLIDLLADGHRAAAMLYTADHGEDIFDDARGRFLHASPLPTYYQLHVPLLIWTSPAYRQAFGEEQRHLEERRGEALGSDCVFHTLLGLGGIETPWRNDSLVLTSAQYRPKRRHYISDHNRPMELKDCLKPQDLEILKRNNQQYD